MPQTHNYLAHGIWHHNSEVFDWGHKLDPQRFGDRDAFMRRYGVNTETSREALRRLMNQYSFVDANTPDVARTETWGERLPDGTTRPIPLSDEQRTAYDEALRAFRAASHARREGHVDVEAIKALSPRSFEGVPTGEHPELAAKLSEALGTLKHGALARVLNEYPAEHNAKVQHTVKLVDSYAAGGKAGVIFAFNRGSVRMLKDELEQRGHKVGVIDGTASADGKARVRAAFDRGEVDVVVASDAGKTGMNLQKRGRYLINYDLPLTQMTLEQRNARIDRLGQGGSIELHHLQTDTAYDDEARRRIERKHRLGSALQGSYESLEDVGLARYLHMAREEQEDGDLPDLLAA